MFADPMFPAMILYMLVTVRVIKLFCLKVADLLGLWMVFKNTDELERSSLAQSLKSGSGSASGSRASRSSKGGSGGTGGITERMKHPDLMHAFLEHNRPWMLQALANILTSEFLARNPPWIVKQIAKVMGVVPGGPGGEEEEDSLFGRTKTTVAADISSDDGSDSGAEAADYGNMDHLLTAAVRKVAQRWLSFVRVQTKPGQQYDISTDSESEPEVNYDPAEITDATRDISEVWLRKVAKFLREERQRNNEKFLAEISSDSETASDGEFGVMEQLNERTVEIANRWLRKIRAAPPPMEGGLRADISSDDSDDEDEPAVEFNFEAPVMSAKTTQIAFRWLRNIRSLLKGGAPAPVRRDDISSDSSGDDEIPGMNKDISSDEDSGGSEMLGEAPELQEPRVKAVAYKWLGRVRRKETKSAWEQSDEVVEDVQQVKRHARVKPQTKK